MAALGSQSIASSYEQLLHVDRDGGGDTTNHVSVKDGDNETTFGFTIASDALMMTSTNRLEFGDNGTYIHQSADGVLDLVSDSEIEINATTIDMNGAVDISGNLTTPGQPAFLVRPASSQDDLPVAATTVVFGTEVFDQGGDFASNTFTAPVTGRYQFNVALYMENIDSAATYINLRLNTSNRNYYNILAPGGFDADNAYWTLTLSVLADMDATDTALVAFEQVGGTAQADIDTSSYFSGYLAC